MTDRVDPKNGWTLNHEMPPEDQIFMFVEYSELISFSGATNFKEHFKDSACLKKLHGSCFLFYPMVLSVPNVLLNILQNLNYYKPLFICSFQFKIVFCVYLV